MKTYKLLQFTCLCLMLFVASCTDDTFVDNRNRVVEGLPAHVQMKFQSEAGQVFTRGEQKPEYENRVDNIYIFVFDAAGEVHFRKFCIQGDGLSFENGSPDHSSGKVFFETTSLNDARIVGIANLTTESTATAYNITEEELDAVTNLDALKAKVMKMNGQAVTRGGLFMMTGYAKSGDSDVVNIPGSEGDTETLNATLQLERTDAKVKFVITTSPSNSKWTEFSFMPKEWTVKQVPMQSYLLEDASGDYNGEDATYFNTPSVVFEEITRDEANSNLYTGGSFVFYMPENKKKPQKHVSDYAQRDAWDTKIGEDKEGNKTFTNAHPNSTYVEMTGVLSYRDGGGQQVSADVRLTVHLGYAKKEDGTADVNDYNTERNGFYTYNVKVRGIDDIIVEVDKQEERRPGYEGDVVYSSEEIFEFDSHYDRRLIKLNKKDIADKMEWSVNTPFSRGKHEMNTEIPEDMRDYRWIKFAINYDYNVDNSHYVKYPGDLNYNDPFPMPGTDNNQPSPYYKPGGQGYNAERETDKARLLDIDQLIRRLQEEVSKQPVSPIFDAEGNVAITVFVDENLYFNHPITGEPGENNRSLWKLTTDKEDRQMHIIAGGSQYSPDGNSSIVHSKFSFKQRSIQTIFNVDKESLTTAWGLESKMETERLTSGVSQRGIKMETSTSNGRKNTLDIILGPDHTNTVHWTDILNTDTNTDSPYALISGYDNALYACMLRNRDLNGDNIVQANEIRWYLTSIDQLTDIFLGEYALDEQSRLYPANPADRENQVRWHYTSSSIQSNDNGTPWWSRDDFYESWILWAEEGASRGGASGSIYDDGSKEEDHNKNKLFSYRCARNLGLALDKPDEEPMDLVKVTDEGGGYYLIDITNMNVKSRRQNYERNPLPLHDERKADNLPYAKFRVSAKVYGGDGQEAHRESWSTEWNDYPWNAYQDRRTYDGSYRTPNQRELLIMSTRMPAGAWGTFGGTKPYYISLTSFSMDGIYPYTDQRDGFLWNSSSGTFFLQNSTEEEGYVRPVQDVQ